jgi:hypothetical protein
MQESLKVQINFPFITKGKYYQNITIILKNNKNKSFKTIITLGNILVALRGLVFEYLMKSCVVSTKIYAGITCWFICLGFCL